MTDSPVLRLEGVAFTHPGGTGVSGLELEIAPGEAVALIGPNGAGKSTLLMGVLGLVTLTDGRIPGRRMPRPTHRRQLPPGARHIPGTA